MKRLSILLLAFMALKVSLMAVLPPLYQGIKELKTILEDKKLGELLGSGDILTDILKVDNGYLLQTNYYLLPVEVIYDPGSQPGPTRFNIVFRDPVPLEKK